MNRLLLIAATLSVAAIVLMFAPSADAGGFGGGNDVFIQIAPGVFVPASSGHRGHGGGNTVFVDSFGRVRVQSQPRVQIDVRRGFGLFRRPVRVFVR